MSSAAKLPHARRWLFDALACLALVAAAGWMGFTTLDGWKGPAYTLTNEIYLPAVMFAKGHGFVNVPVDSIPGLRDFIHDTTGMAHFDVQPDAIQPVPWEMHQRFHRYLVYCMGFVWRLFGVSWPAAKILAVGLYAFAALAAYAFFRQCLPKYMAAFAGLLYVLSPVVFLQINNIRDFAKTPFLILVFALLLYLLRQKNGLRLLWIAAALGLAVGVGLGFRRDAAICVPPVLLALCFAPFPAAAPWRRRAAACGVFAAALVLVAWPLFDSVIGKDSLVWHDAIMGMANPLEENLGLLMPATQYLTQRHDIVIGALSYTHEARVLFQQDRLSEMQAYDECRAYVFQAFAMTPADFALRCYAAVLQVLRDVSAYSAVPFTPFQPVVFWAGIPCGALAACLAFRRRPATGWLVSAVFFYFAAVVSLQYEWRHVHHLYVLPLAAILICIVAALRGFLAVWRGAPLEPLRGMRHAALLFALLPLAWLAAAGIQAIQLTRLENRLASVELQKLSVSQAVNGEWTFFLFEKPLPEVLPLDITLQLSPFITRYLAIDFTGFPEGAPIYVLTENFNMPDFVQPIYADAQRRSEGDAVRLFLNFPEYRFRTEAYMLRGIGVPTAYAANFQAVHAVLDREPIFMNPTYTLSENAPWYKRLQFGPVPQRFFPPIPWLEQKRQIEDAFARGDLASAAVQLEQPPTPLLGPLNKALLESKRLLLSGAREDALDLLLDTLRENPELEFVGGSIEQALTGATPELVRATWSRAMEIAPGNSVVKDNAYRLDLPSS